MEFVESEDQQLCIDAAALAIYSPAGSCGAHRRTLGSKLQHRYMEMLLIYSVLHKSAKKGVLALMCDSTNAERPGFTPSEKTVGKTFDTLFEEHKNTRIFVATFASNVDRVQQIINTAYRKKKKKKTFFSSIIYVLNTAIEFQCINIPEIHW